MAGSLRPAVSGATQKSSRRVVATHGAGLLAGALFMALALAFVGSVLSSAGMRLGLVIILAITVVLALGQNGGVALPQSSWQVPEYWRRTLDPDVLPVAYGAILGFGIFTAVVVGAFWVFVAATLLQSLPLALAGWLAYASGRIVSFRFAIQAGPPERMFITRRQRKLIIAATTVVAMLAVYTYLT